MSDRNGSRTEKLRREKYKIRVTCTKRRRKKERDRVIRKEKERINGQNMKKVLQQFEVR